MNATSGAKALAGAGLSLFAAIALADHPSPLPWTYTTGLFDYEIAFTASNPRDCSLEEPPEEDDLNYMPIDQAVNMALALDSGDNPVPGFPAGYHLGYTSLGFVAPDWSDNMFTYDCAPGGVHDDADCDNGRANSTGIIMPSTRYCTAPERKLRGVMGHELFHKVQSTYGASSGAWGKALFEGTARMMEDHIYDDIDADPTLFFWNEVADYLGDPNRDFWTTGYETALGWKYAAEQFGTTLTEPQIGVNFIRKLWENVETVQDSPDVPGVFDQTIRDFDEDASLQGWFRDFTIANVAREFDASALPDADKYRYIDENDGNGILYTDVDRDNYPSDGMPPVIPGAIPLVSAVTRWGAAYYEVTVGTACLPGWFLGYRIGDVSGVRPALLAVDDSDTIVRLLKGGGEEFAASFLQRTPPGRYARLIAAVAGGDDQEAFNYAFDCGPGDLEIRRPDSTYKAFVGPAQNPKNLLVRMLITGPETLSDSSVLGLQPEDFEVYVGGNGNPADEATVLTGAYVQGEYWLTVDPPTKPNQATYDLHVTLGGSLVDTRSGSVSYEQRLLDQVLVIDRSGSMLAPEVSPKIEAARNAARLFADLVGSSDRLGAVSFSGDNSEPNDDATVDEALAAATEGQRDDVKDEIGALVADGGTSIGDGLARGASEIAINGSAIGEDWIMLLSDGMENEAQFWAQVEGAIKADGIRISAIALGADADQLLLQEIASQTGGEYYYVDAGTLGVRALGAGASMANNLADAYAAASESMRRQQRLWESGGVLSTPAEHVIPIAGGGIVNATFLFNWDDPADALDVLVRRPDGSPVQDGAGGAQIYQDDTHVVVQLNQLGAGDWTVELEAAAGAPRYIAMLSGDDRQGPQLDVRFAQNAGDPIASAFGGLFLRGLRQPILAQLVDRGGAIEGAEVRARIEHPDSRVIELPLYDDGEHGDGFGGDGVYGNLYTRTTSASYGALPDVPGIGTRGSYNVSVEAQGTDNLGNAFVRLRKASFQIFETDLITGLPTPDTDGDGMPDRYEDLHECLDKNIVDAFADGEEDGLSNFGEWTGGTDPCHPDTDRGGEVDVSELGRAANPFDPADDALPRPIDAEVIDYVSEHLDFPAHDDLHSEANLIRYQVHPAYEQIRLLRSNFSNGPFMEVALFPAQAQGGLYYDEGLTNGVTYYYKVQPVDVNGNLAAASHVFSGRPMAEPVPPIGSVLINMDDAATTTTAATLSLAASSDTTLMMVDDESNFDDAVWQPFATTLPWTLHPHAATSVATVFVKYMDAAGNESPTTYQDSIEIVSAGDVGTLKGSALLAGQPDHTAILVQVARPSGIAPAFTKPSGVYELRYVEPGTHDVVYSYPGYESEVVEDVVVEGGDLINMGVIILGALDTDADGIPDVGDNCTLVPNEDQRDTNGDGFGNICDPDLNDDHIVNFSDVGLLKSVFFTADEDADLDGNGAVNFVDLGIAKQYFFLPPGPGGVAP